MKAPFQPTTCACKADRSNCTRQPGHLLPGQLQEILQTLGAAVSEAPKYFWRSPGMVLGRLDGSRFRLNTITPRFEDGKCVFFTADGRCSIHAVAPFGCRYFDMHMTARKAQKRAQWGVREILSRLDEYQAERDALPEATHYAPQAF